MAAFKKARTPKPLADNQTAAAADDQAAVAPDYPPAFTYTLVWGGPGEFSWKADGSGKAVYFEGNKWVQRDLKHAGTSDYYHFAEVKLQGKQRRVWAFAVEASKPTTVPLQPLYAVGFYYAQNMKGTWTNDMWAVRA